MSLTILFAFRLFIIKANYEWKFYVTNLELERRLKMDLYLRSTFSCSEGLALQWAAPILMKYYLQQALSFYSHRQGFSFTERPGLFTINGWSIQSN